MEELENALFLDQVRAQSHTDKNVQSSTIFILIFQLCETYSSLLMISSCPAMILIRV